MPAYAVILVAGIVWDGSPEPAFVLIGAGGFSILQTILIILRVAAIGTEPLIKMSLKVGLTLLAVCAAVMIFCDLTCFSLAAEW